MLDAKRLNDRAVHLRGYYRDRLKAYLEAFYQEGYVVGTEPPKNAQEEFGLLTPQVMGLLQLAADESQPQGLRDRAQRGLQRWLSLRRQLHGSRNGSAETKENP
jgi:hypothetical protein